jgi:5-methyltetrahydrofolate--homocysteine methyltransferase
MIIVGERLNSSRKNVREAFEKRDRDFLLQEALGQKRSGAAYLDINAAALLDKEMDTLRWAIPLLQEHVGLPLSLDTPNVEAMIAGFQIHKGRPLLNSLTGEARRIQSLLPVIREFGPQVIALCLDDSGLPATADQALKLAEKLASLLLKEGLKAGDIFIDPLVRPLGVDQRSALLFLESLALIKKRLPEVRTIAGLSNISFGLPQRKLLNRTLILLARDRGLDAAICDPLDKDLRASLSAAEALLGQDPSLKQFLRFSRELKA